MAEIHHQSRRCAGFGQLFGGSFNVFRAVVRLFTAAQDGFVFAAFDLLQPVLQFGERGSGAVASLLPGCIFAWKAAMKA
ncbi:MAG: hypothetical protein ACFNQI_08465, partial [Eikenella corrodens]